MGDLRVRFGNRLRALRNWKGMTQEQLAEAADVSVDFISLVERGISAPSFETLERLSVAFDVPVAELFHFEG